MNPWNPENGGAAPGYPLEQFLARFTVDYWWRIVGGKMGFILSVNGTFIAIALMLGVIGTFYAIWGVNVKRWGKAVGEYRDNGPT